MALTPLWGLLQFPLSGLELPEYLKYDGLNGGVVKVMEQDNLSVVWAWDLHLVPSI